ncbi:unnamed protein product, partial [Polarella glacialis]
GTHQGLEERFHTEVSLPLGYELGDWERIAKQQEMNPGGEWDCIDGLPSPSPGEEVFYSGELEEQKSVFSILRAAEFVAKRPWYKPPPLGTSEVPQILQSLRIAVLLAQKGVRDPEALQSALLMDTVRGEVEQQGAVVREFGEEVASILRALSAE